MDRCRAGGLGEHDYGRWPVSVCGLPVQRGVGPTGVAPDRCSVDVGSIATTEPARDTYFRDTALQFNQFPKATFTFANPVAVVCPRAGQPQSFTATGEFTLHGVTKTVTVTLNVVLTSRISSESDPTVND